jgi:hypothetical protein
LDVSILGKEKQIFSSLDAFSGRFSLILLGANVLRFCARVLKVQPQTYLECDSIYRFCLIDWSVELEENNIYALNCYSTSNVPNLYVQKAFSNSQKLVAVWNRHQPVQFSERKCPQPMVGG